MAAVEGNHGGFDCGTKEAQATRVPEFVNNYICTHI